MSFVSADMRAAFFEYTAIIVKHVAVFFYRRATTTRRHHNCLNAALDERPPSIDVAPHVVQAIGLLVSNDRRPRHSNRLDRI